MKLLIIGGGAIADCNHIPCLRKELVPVSFLLLQKNTTRY